MQLAPISLKYSGGWRSSTRLKLHNSYRKQKLLDKLSPKRRSENMRRIQSKDTSPELLVRRMVFGLGFRYRLHDPQLPGKPDLVFRRVKKIIEVRGCFWHQHVNCIDSHIPKSRIDYWLPKLERNVARDHSNTRLLKQMGWRVFVVWECEIKNTSTLEKRIVKFLTPDRKSAAVPSAL